MNEQMKHYDSKLAFETDSWNLEVALESGENVLVIGARSSEAYQKEHVPGAINIPHRSERRNNETSRQNICDYLLRWYLVQCLQPRAP